jgi:hypothetical protein
MQIQMMGRITSIKDVLARILYQMDYSLASKEVKGGSGPARGADTQKSTGAPKIFTEDEIKNRLTDYFKVPRELWKSIPPRSHVRYFVKDRDDASLNARFRVGGFVTYIKSDEDAEYFGLERDLMNGANNARWSVQFADVDTIWKKYARESIVELQMIFESLLQKKEQIEALERSVAALDARLARIEPRMRPA